MNLYFIKSGNKYLSKKSKIIPNDMFVDFTFYMNEGRYWDNLGSVKGQITKLREAGYQVYIVQCNVVEDKLL